MLSTCYSFTRPSSYTSISIYQKVHCVIWHNFHGPHWRKFTISCRSPETIIFSGIQPTGVPHLGNYLGALQQWVKLQDQSAPNTKLLFSIVDLHALTIPKDRARLRRWRIETLATLLAVGLDPKKCTIFFQSDVC